MLLIIVLLLLFSGGFGWFGYSRGGPYWGGGGFIGPILIALLVLALIGRL